MVIGTKPSILLVEDEKDLAYVVKEVLSTLPAEIIVAKNGWEAVQIIESGRHFDLVLLDLVLPQISGLEVLRRLRRISAGTRVILSTGYAASFDPEDLGRLDVFSVLGKPYTPDELLSVVRRALGSEPSESS
jgi:two-component system CheB/CheR fusion protein